MQRKPEYFRFLRPEPDICSSPAAARHGLMGPAEIILGDFMAGGRVDISEIKLRASWYFASGVAARGPVDDPTFDQKKDHGDRRDADRVDGCYRSSDDGTGDASRRSRRRARIQLHA